MYKMLKPIPLALTLFVSPLAMAEEAQLILNANILTLADAQPTATAMAVAAGRILAVGDEAAARTAAGVDAEVYDLDGATVVPGFIETHDHMLMHGAVTTGWADLTPATTRDRDHAIAKLHRQPLDDQGWVLGFGVEPLLYANEEGRDTWRKTLDAAFPDLPVFLLHNSGHAAYANSRLFELAGITRDTVAPPGGEFVLDDDGELEGFIRGRPTLLTIRGFPTVTPESTRQAARQRAAVGITTASELAIATPQMLDLIEAVTSEPGFPVRLVGGMFVSMPGLVEIAPTARNHETDLFRLVFIKSWSDGSLQGGTAALSEGYFKLDNGGISGLTMTQEAFDAQVLGMYDLGYWPALHANGDLALDMALTSVERAQAATGNHSIRPQFIHCQVTRPEQLERLAATGGSCSYFSSHIYYYGDLHLDLILGSKRGARISALRWAIDRGIPATMHDDAPVAATNPLLNMWAVVNRKTRSGRALDPDLRLTPMEALAAYTRDAAWQFGMEEELGTLETGKHADFVVLDADPRTVDPQKIRDIRVLATVMNGRVTHLAGSFYSPTPGDPSPR